MKIVKLGFSSLACVFTALGACSAVAVAADDDFASLQASSTVPVSYTHLTLPTIYSV